jgi:malate synthase
VTRRRDEVEASAAQLLDVRVPGGAITEAGLRTNVSVGIQYIESWLRGVGAAAINNLMEDAATAEISRSQVWQWVRHGARTAEGTAITRDAVRATVAEELARIEAGIGTDYYSAGRFQEAASLFEQVSLSDEFVEFLTLPAYEHID